MKPITFADVSEAIAAVLSRKWPERTIYRDVCPTDHERPAFFLQCGKTSMAPESLALWRFKAEYLLIQYDEKDEFYEVSAERLLMEQVQVLALFSAPVLEVEGRYPSMTAVAGEGRDADTAFVTIRVEWLGPPPAYLKELEEAADTETMEDFFFRRENNKTNDEKEC